jgi:hypothetical protein
LSSNNTVAAILTAKRIRTGRPPDSSLPRYPSRNLVDAGCLIYNGRHLHNSCSSYELGLGVFGVIGTDSCYLRG